MSMYNDSIWGFPGNENNCVANLKNVAPYAKRFHSGVGHFWDLVVRKKWYGTHVNKHMVNEQIAEITMINLAESGHPIFQATSRKGWEENHSYTGSEETLNCFSAQSFLSISLVSTKQPQSCAMNQNHITLKVRSVNLW